MSATPMADRLDPSSHDESSSTPSDPEGPVERLRRLEAEYDQALRAAGAAETRRATLELHLRRARRDAAVAAVSDARLGQSALTLATLPASEVRVSGRALEWRSESGAAQSVELRDLESLALGQRAKLRHTLLASACFIAAILSLAVGPLRWPLPSVMLAGFAMFFLLAAAGAAVVLSGLRHHLIVRLFDTTLRIPLDPSDVVAEGGKPCNADRFVATAKEAIEAARTG